jgi:hypothetical protein
MKKATGFGLGLLALGGITAIASSIVSSREDRVSIAQEVVNKWAPVILKELALKDEEGILGKITVTDEILTVPTAGNIEHQIQYPSIFRTNGTYVPNSASIIIYAENMVRIHTPKRALKNFGIFGLTYRKMVFFTLAHELRHFWQLRTGEFHKNSIMINAVDVTPYDQRWVEKDANTFALKLMEQYKTQI